MWDLKTIIALNEKATELAAQGRPILHAFREIGINGSPKKQENQLDKEEKEQKEQEK